MKHNNESISRLDGDIYETCAGQYIAIGKIVSIEKVDCVKYDYGFNVQYENGTRLFINYGPHFLVTSEIFSNVFGSEDYSQIKDSIQKTRDFVSEKRNEFIEVWKHWKKQQIDKQVQRGEQHGF